MLPSLFLTLAAVQAQTAPPTLTIATREAPPFVILRPDGGWEGISIDLWRRMALGLGVSTTIRPMGLEDMLSAAAEGRVDAAVAALTVTADRERIMDFSHPFYTSGLSIAVVAERRGLVRGLIAALASTAFLRAMAGLLVLLAAVGLVVWLLERRRNPDHFGGAGLAGPGAGFWWAAVTMTTVGYGDKAPVTPLGRTAGFIWMFVSIVTISGFTAAIASSLTVGSLRSRIEGPDDLKGTVVATLAGSTSEDYLTGRGVATLPLAGVPEALDSLSAGAVDAVVYDAPLLRYWVKERRDRRLTVLPRVFERQDYAIALPQQSPWRERINEQLLLAIEDPAWQEVLTRYLGEE